MELKTSSDRLSKMHSLLRHSTVTPVYIIHRLYFHILQKIVMFHLVGLVSIQEQPQKLDAESE